MKNQLVICLAAYLAAACLPAMSQETGTLLKNKYEHETLMLEGNRDEYRKDTEWKRIGVFKPKIEQEFYTSSTESKQEIGTFRKQRRRGTALLIAGSVVFVSALVVAPVVILPVFIGTYGAGIGTYCVGAVDLHKSRRHLHKAIWLHNRDVIAKR